MATPKQVGIRLTTQDLELLSALQVKTGIGNRTDVIRLAIRRLAEMEGVVPIPPPKKKR